jgi:hypothetical protein
MKLVMNIQFEPGSTSESDSGDEHEIIDSVRNAIEAMQPVIEGIGAKIEGIGAKILDDDLLNKMVSPRTAAFKDFWDDMSFEPAVPFQSVFLAILSIAESLDMNTRVVRFGVCDAERFAKGIRNHTIFSLIPIIIDGVTLL